MSLDKEMWERIERVKQEIKEYQQMIDFILEQPNLLPEDRIRVKLIEDRLEFKRYLIRILESRQYGSPN